MLRKKRHGHAPHRQMEMVSLTDVIFLLLIFALLQAFKGTADTEDKDSSGDMTIRLGQVSQVGEIEQQFVSVYDNISKKTDTMTYPIDDAFFRDDSAEFALRHISEFIMTNISRYVRERDSVSGRERIHVEIDMDTPFRMVDFIIRRCSVSKENVVMFASQAKGN